MHGESHSQSLSLEASSRPAQNNGFLRVVQGFSAAALLACGACDMSESTPQHPGVIDSAVNCKEALVSGEVEKIIEEEAKMQGVDVNLVKAVVWTESHCNPHALSNKGAQGLMQLNPKYHKLKNAEDSKENIHEGVTELARLLKVYKGNTELSLAAYNAGEGAVKKAGHKIPQNGETEFYVSRILERKHYLDILG